MGRCRPNYSLKSDRCGLACSTIIRSRPQRPLSSSVRLHAVLQRSRRGFRVQDSQLVRAAASYWLRGFARCARTRGVGCVRPRAFRGRRGMELGPPLSFQSYACHYSFRCQSHDIAIWAIFKAGWLRLLSGLALMTELCHQCHERPATNTLPWYIQIPWAIFGGGFTGKLCGDCTGGLGFVALFWLAAVAVSAFVVAVIVW